MGKQNVQGLSRRSFIGLGAAAVAGSLVAAGCASQNKEEQLSQTGSYDSVTWDHEVDFLLIGSGTGAFGALRAAQNGASVLVVEKGDMWGGTSATSGGGFGLPLSEAEQSAGANDSKEQVIRYYMAASGGRADEAVIGKWLDYSPVFETWTHESLGWNWSSLGEGGLFRSDYYEPVDGWTKFGRSATTATDAEGNELGAAEKWNSVRQGLEEAGAEVWMGSPATRLIVDENGNVAGAAVAKDGKDEVCVRAGAVLLATGGFEHDDEMRRRHLPNQILASCTNPGNTGDGHKMAAAIGAQLSHMDCFFGVPSILTTGDDPDQLWESGTIAQEIQGTDWAMYRNLPGAVVVNALGHRFANEGSAYDPFARAFANFDNASMTQANAKAFLICDADYWNSFSVPGHTAAVGAGEGGGAGEYLDSMRGSDAEEELPAWFVKADTLEELAEKLGIDAAGLVAEIEDFNTNAEQGIDPKFHRGESYFDQSTTALLAAARTDVVNSSLAPVKTAPFYGARYVPSTYSTSGGLAINENAQVLNWSGEPIGNLYACGCCAVGIAGGRYVNGIALSSGAIMGYIAAEHATGADQA